MKEKLIDRVTPVQESWHVCWKYKDSIKTVYCVLCKNKEYNDQKKLATLRLTKISTQ